MSHLTVRSTVDEVRKVYPYMAKQHILKCQEEFTRFDANSDDTLDLFEIKRLLEALGKTMTHVQTIKWIKEIDTSGTQTINFNDFMMACYPPEGKKPIVLLKHVENSAMASQARKFEEKIRDAQGTTEEEQREAVKKAAALRKEEREERKRQQEKKASQARFAERMGAFGK
mmetsp:Transcript_9285/g.10270  ORF Transcript_9285/g.10270 Transcript_9285/m.10270 type:complete len:171 (+) Transcript_9285:89-601(+)